MGGDISKRGVTYLFVLQVKKRFVKQLPLGVSIDQKRALERKIRKPVDGNSKIMVL